MDLIWKNLDKYNVKSEKNKATVQRLAHVVDIFG